jgi:curved DNA-binding protein CbpA
MKDYNQILGCTPMSTKEEIKKQYRKLALQYHPDKNQNNKYADALFHDVKEAYETLTNPTKKEAWLQERWLRQVMNQSTSNTQPLTPYSILNSVLKLDRNVSMQDVFRMDQDSIRDSLLTLVCEDNIKCLLDFGEYDINRTIVQHLLSAAQPIDYHRLELFWPKLRALSVHDAELIKQIDKYQRNRRSAAYREKWTLPIALLAALLLCLLMYIMGR